MLFANIIQAAKYKIIEGSEFLWSCYGSNARYLDFSADKSQSGISCIFDSENQTVYEVHINTIDNQYYRWINPEFIKEIKKESKKRNVDFKLATDENQWVDIKDEKIMLEKIAEVM